MCEGEFESLKAIHAISPGFVPEPYAWGKYTREDPETCFLLAEFRDIKEQACALGYWDISVWVVSPASFLFLLPTVSQQVFYYLPIIRIVTFHCASRASISKLMMK